MSNTVSLNVEQSALCRTVPDCRCRGPDRQTGTIQPRGPVSPSSAIHSTSRPPILLIHHDSTVPHLCPPPPPGPRSDRARPGHTTEQSIHTKVLRLPHGCLHLSGEALSQDQPERGHQISIPGHQGAVVVGLVLGSQPAVQQQGPLTGLDELSERLLQLVDLVAGEGALHALLQEGRGVGQRAGVHLNTDAALWGIAEGRVNEGVT